MHAETFPTAPIRAELLPKTKPRRMRILLRVGGLATPIGQRAASIAHLLLAIREGLTRVEMLRVGTPGLALGAPGYICRLRKAGAPIESVPVIGLDAAGEPVRFVRYVLRGEIQITREPWPQEEGTR